ncbi:VOC family protein [Plastoroseomonas arctica]|uniref:VOC family protein n=1 Tax=Plastoroseomonas arctica TaxID=1509237 RepID=A0AAF1K3S4_9PROT|nr:VOC family protein [Plastoroseomonas arctica]MBR0655704.1 VOC family protein [Plastoroseomonas arctica]
MRFAVDRLDHLVITCRDVGVMASWYQRVLGMDVVAFGPHNRTALSFGGQKINLRPASMSQEEWWSGVAPAPGSQDLCFIVTVAAEEVADHLTRCGVTIASGPELKDGALGPIRSVYCRDPDGNLIEISSYQD